MPIVSKDILLRTDQPIPEVFFTELYINDTNLQKRFEELNMVGSAIVYMAEYDSKTATPQQRQVQFELDKINDSPKILGKNLDLLKPVEPDLETDLTPEMLSQGIFG